MMSYKDNRYRDTYTHTDNEPSIITNCPSYLYRIVERVELTDECIQKIAERVVELIKDEKAEVEPVRHGKWIFEPKDAIEMMHTKPKCSECGYESADGLHYCSNCGAKMDEQG